MSLRSSLIILFFSCLFLLSSCGRAGKWRVYETSEFSIEFPGSAQDTVVIAGGAVTAKSYFLPIGGVLDSNLYYSVSLYSFPDSILFTKGELTKLFKSDTEVYAWSINGTFADSGRVVKSGGIEGMEYKIIIDGSSGISTIRKFVLGKHLYTLTVVTENKKLKNSSIKRFLDSFKLKKNKATT
jgi:hypothetical protein